MCMSRTEKSFLTLSLYVDDLILAENYMEMIFATKWWLSSTFEMDIGEVNYVLEVKILRDQSRKLLGLSHNSKPIHSNQEGMCIELLPLP